MAGHAVAGVAVGAHTGRGPHLAAEQRGRVLRAWRTALPLSVIVAGAASVTMAAEAKPGGADVLLAFPGAADPGGYHETLSRELPGIGSYLSSAAGRRATATARAHPLLAPPH